MIRVRSSTWGSTFFFSLFLIKSLHHGYELPFLADNSKYIAALSFIFKAYTKGYVVNSCLANPDNEAVSHSATCSTNL